MPIEVETPDGGVAEFPDGTPKETITAVLRKRFGKPAAPAKKPLDYVPGTPQKFRNPDVEEPTVGEAFMQTAPTMLGLMGGPMIEGAPGVVGAAGRALASPAAGAASGAYLGYKHGGIPGAAEGAILGYAGVKGFSLLGKFPRLYGLLRGGAEAEGAAGAEATAARTAAAKALAEQRAARTAAIKAGDARAAERHAAQMELLQRRLQGKAPLAKPTGGAAAPAAAEDAAAVAKELGVTKDFARELTKPAEGMATTAEAASAEGAGAGKNAFQEATGRLAEMLGQGSGEAAGAAGPRFTSEELALVTRLRQLAETSPSNKVQVREVARQVFPDDWRDILKMIERPNTRMPTVYTRPRP